MSEFDMPLWHACQNNEELLDFLINAACPIVCVNHVNETGWHEECIKRGNAAFKELRGWILDRPRSV